MNVLAWTKRTAATATPDATPLTDPGFLARFLSGDHVVDIRMSGQRDDVPSSLRHATRITLVEPSRNSMILPFADESQDAVVADHTLEHIADYRYAIAEWFRVLRVGGFLVITVPHQFLFERKLSLPSRFDASHLRFYTAASLLLEIEEALDPLSYRVRFVEDNDAAFNRHRPPERAPTGRCEIVVALEKIDRPDYSDAVMADPQPKSKTADALPIVRTPTAANGPTICIRSTPGDVRTIAAMKLDHRGDFIMAKPALQELRRRFPSAKLTLICGSWNAPDAMALSICDEILTFDYFSEDGTSVPSRQRGHVFLAFADMMRGRSFDLAVDLRVDTDTRPLLAEIDAGQRAGFGSPEQFSFLDIALPFVNPTQARRWRTIDFEQFTSYVGTRNESGVTLEDRSSFIIVPKRLLRSPRIALDAGIHMIEVDIRPTGLPFIVYIKVHSDRRAKISKKWFACLAKPGSSPHFDLHIGDAGEIELSVLSRAFGFVQPFRFAGCRLFKRGEWQGPHQQELMYMLACVIGLRMNNPYKVYELTS